MNSYEDPALSVECDLRHGVDRLAAENAALKEQLAEVERDAARYRYVRTLNPHEFDSLVRRNIRDDLAFDSLVDAALQEREP